MTVLEPEVVAPVDPRMRARRIAVRRSGARKRLRRLVALGVVVVTLAAGGLALRSPLLDVDRIEVLGAQHSGADVVRGASGIALRAAMIDVDTAAARSKLLALPWVAEVSVTRRWPATVEVRVRERTAVAAEPAGQGGFALVDGTGRVLAIEPAPPAGLVRLAGGAPAGTPGTDLAPEAGPALAVAKALPPSLIPRVESVRTLQGGAVDLQVAGTGVVHLGAPDALQAKLLAALTVLEQVDLTDVCAIDVRVPSAPTLTRGSPCL
ncbi:MAG: cell division protein FtsQ/DivIB [Acidimicrobiales bacterium]